MLTIEFDIQIFYSWFLGPYLDYFKFIIWWAPNQSPTLSSWVEPTRLSPMNILNEIAYELNTHVHAIHSALHEQSNEAMSL